MCRLIPAEPSAIQSGTGGLLVGRSLDCPECDRYLPGHSRRRDTFLGQTYAGTWRKSDIAYPVLGAMAFGISTTLRNSGLNQFPNPLLAAAVIVGTAFLVLCAIAHLGFSRRGLQFNHQGSGWLFAAALFNAGAILSLFFALNMARSLKSSR
jgi:hypothetical protein